MSSERYRGIPSGQHEVITCTASSGEGWRARLLCCSADRAPSVRATSRVNSDDISAFPRTSAHELCVAWTEANGMYSDLNRWFFNHTVLDASAPDVQSPCQRGQQLRKKCSRLLASPIRCLCPPVDLLCTPCGTAGPTSC